MSKSYKIEEGSLHEQFQNSRAKIQMFAGGFGNGKTTGAVIKAIQLAKDYPGCNGLVARSTFPKLNSTIRKEFEAWIPKSWIERDVNSRDNLIQLKNGSVINFSYIAQGGKQAESSTSNLLSATYDWIVVDQIEDPEISHKDFLDLLGRLRGSTTYQSKDPTMPTTGPRWMILMCNPTRNWVYRKLVKPVQDLKAGIQNEELLWDEDEDKPMIEIFEGSTYANAANLPADFIKTQERAYKGQMRSRFLLGEWGAYEGLVYPQYEQTKHVIRHEEMLSYYRELAEIGFIPSILESYDHGIAKQACYLYGFADHMGNVFILDGLYEKELMVSQIAKHIRRIRDLYQFNDRSSYFPPELIEDAKIFGDPAIFKRATGNAKSVGVTTAQLFKDEGIVMQRANNNIMTGIAKVQSYLAVDEWHKHPFTEDPGAPHLFISSKCDYIDREITDYYWSKDTSGEYEDEPQDKNDHAMDAVKYLLTARPKLATRIEIKPPLAPRYRQWREVDAPMKDRRSHRYA